MSSPSGKYFAPKPGRFGKQVVFLVGPAGVGAAATFTASDTTVFDVPTPFRKLYFEKAAAHARTVPAFSAAGASGIGVATVFRVRAGTSTAITASLTLDTLASTVTSFTILAAASANAFYVAEGDNFEVQVSMGTATVTTAAADLTFVIEASVLE